MGNRYKYDIHKHKLVLQYAIGIKLVQIIFTIINFKKFKFNTETKHTDAVG